MLFSKLIKRYLIQILASGMLFFSAFASAHEGHTTYGTAYHLLVLKVAICQRRTPANLMMIVCRH